MEPQGAILVVVIPAHAPGVNHQYQHTSDGRHFLTKDAQNWLNLATGLTIQCRINYKWCDPGGEFEAHIWHNDTRKDVDGPAKIIIDAVFKAIGVNDHRLRKLTIERFTADSPTVRIEIRQTLETTR